MPIIYFSEIAYRKTCKEINRWYNVGLNKKGKPYEAVVFPFTWINLKNGINKCPAELIMLDDILSIIVTNVAIPDDEIKNYSATNANFRVKGIDNKYYWDMFVKKKIAPTTRRYPLLSIISRLHTHPFAKQSFHSMFDKKTFQKDEVRARIKGFNMSFGFLATPQKISKEIIDWKMAAYLINHDGTENELDLCIVKDSHSEIIKAKRQPFYKDKYGKKWGDEFMNILNKRFLQTKIMRKSQGWTSYWFRESAREFILFLPPFFPVEDERLYVSEGTGFIEKNYKRKKSQKIWKLKPNYLLQAIIYS